MNVSKRWQNLGIVGGLLLLTAALRFYGIGWGLPDVYEEATPLRRAWGIWGWGPENSFDPNPHFFNYPSLTIYVQFAGQCLLFVFMKVFGAISSTIDFRTLYIAHPTAFFLIGRAITAFFGIGTVWLTYVVGRRIGGQTVAVPAALLLAVNTVHIADSQLAGVDVPLTFFVTAFLWAALRLVESPTERNYVIAGALLGLATSTKYTGALLLVGLLAAHFFACRQTTSARRTTWNLLGLAVVAAVFVFYAASPYVLLDSGTFRHDLAAERQHMRFGHFGLEGSAAWLYYARALTGSVLGWPAMVSALSGLVLFAAVRRRPWAVVLAVFAIVYAVTIGTWSMRAERYLLPILPVALVFAGAAVQALLRVRPLPRPASFAAAAVLTLILAAPVVAKYPQMLERLEPDPRSEARRWIETNIPRGSFVVSEPYGPALVGPLQLWSDASEIQNHVVADSSVALYAVQLLPMYQVQPERSAVFYDMHLHQTADVIVTSSAIRSRYVKDPARFPRQVAFYDSLDAGFEILARFSPPTGPAPTIVVYGNPRQTISFSRRELTEDPQELRPERPGTYGGEEGFFYYNLGLNYATFANPQQALACYEMALNYPLPSPGRHVAVVKRMIRSLRDAELHQQAASLLALAIARAPTPATRERLTELREER